MSRGLTIGPLWFQTKAAAVKYTKDVLWQSPLGDLPEPHIRFVWTLLQLHKSASQKIGCGVKAFQVRTNLPYGSRSFWLIRHDGSETDFSYRECLLPSTSRLDVMLAFRSEVSHQIVAFRDSELRRGLVCEITGVPIEKTACEVDHAPPDTFAKLVDAFLKQERLDMKDIRFQEGDAQTKAALHDRLMAVRWQEFHRHSARLRVLSLEGHRRITRPEPA